MLTSVLLITAVFTSYKGEWTDVSRVQNGTHPQYQSYSYDPAKSQCTPHSSHNASSVIRHTLFQLHFTPLHLITREIPIRRLTSTTVLFVEVFLGIEEKSSDQKSNTTGNISKNSLKSRLNHQVQFMRIGHPICNFRLMR